MFYRERFFIANTDAVCDAQLYDVILPQEDFITPVTLVLNSSLTLFVSEMLGRHYGGGGGPLKLQVYEAKNLLILHPTFIKLSNFTGNKEILSIFTELGFDPSKPIREQEPNPLPDRKALDDIVFDALGLTEEERKEVYWAVAELVKNRLDKAKSV